MPIDVGIGPNPGGWLSDPPGQSTLPPHMPGLQQTSPFIAWFRMRYPNREVPQFGTREYMQIRQEFDEEEASRFGAAESLKRLLAEKQLGGGSSGRSDTRIEDPMMEFLKNPSFTRYKVGTTQNPSSLWNW